MMFGLFSFGYWRSKDTVWLFHAETRTAPDWHSKVTDPRTPPMLEVGIRVCHAPCGSPVVTLFTVFVVWFKFPFIQ